MDLEAAAAAWRRGGFVVLPGYLAGPDLEMAKAGLSSVYPTGEEYHADPLSERNRGYTGDEYGGVIPFPFPTVPLCNLAIDDKVIAFVEAAFGTDDVRIYASELWAKYSGAANYEQEHHRDYLNHTPLAPSSDIRWRGLEMFIWLSDVTEDLGPTQVVPLADSEGLPALPHGYTRNERKSLYEHEASGAGPAGTVVVYSTDTFHRGTELKARRAARFSIHASYRHADNTWTSRHAWGDQSLSPRLAALCGTGDPAATAPLWVPSPWPSVLDPRDTGGNRDPLSRSRCHTVAKPLEFPGLTLPVPAFGDTSAVWGYIGLRHRPDLRTPAHEVGETGHRKASPDQG